MRTSCGVTRGLHAAGFGPCVRLAMVAMLASLVVAGAAEARSAPPPTGQIDGALVATGLLRDALLSNGRAARSSYPAPTSTITIRSSLRLGHGPNPPRVLLVAFRSRAGARCLGISVYRAGASGDAPECLKPCRQPMCLLVVRGGTLPDGARVVVGVVDPHADEIRVTDRRQHVRRYRLSRARVEAPVRMVPILVHVVGVVSVQSFGDGTRLHEVRFPAAS